MAATSMFAYPLTRRYPSHFTWIILVGGTILITLFTFIAVAGNAYQLQPKYTNDPNATESHRKWFQKKPFNWASEMETTCQASLLTIGGEYMTTNQVFRYTIERFRVPGGNATDASATENDSSDIVTGSNIASSAPLTAAYKNSTLKDCQVREIVIELLRRDETRPPRNYWAWGNTNARSTTQCMMDTELGPLMVNFTSQLPPVKRNNDITEAFLALNESAHPGRWVGAQMTKAWYGKLSLSMGWSVPVGANKTRQDIDDGSASWGSGTIILTRNESVTDYESSTFFAIRFDISDTNGGLSWLDDASNMQDWMDEWKPESPKHYFLPNISANVDVFAKSYYSLLLSDFNSTDETNALSTAQGLRYLQSVNCTTLAEDQRALAIKSDDADPRIGLINDYYDPDTTNLTQPLRTLNHTTLFSQYLCSVPKEKSTFNLIFAVVLADIVFLSACWTLFGWIAAWWMGRKDKTFEHCEGCAGPKDVLLADMPGSAGGQAYSRVPSVVGDDSGGNGALLGARSSHASSVMGTNAVAPRTL